MAKDYFQDIVPPNEPSRPSPERRAMDSADIRPQPTDAMEQHDAQAPAERSIRNISAPSNKPRTTRPMTQEHDDFAPLPPRRGGRSFSRWLIWGIAILAVIALGVLGLFMFRKTTVTVTPRSQSFTFDQNSQYTAYPAATAASGTLAYSIVTLDLQDSQVVPTQGTEHADVKASGNITVYNDYSSASVKLIKNTRFATPDGLIFRTPADVVVPGKKGSSPGSVTITVVADQTGQQYNVGPISKFTVPGLQSTPAMYNNIYAQSSQAFSGGFSGDRPAAAPGAMDTALSTVRGRLQQQAMASAQSSASTTVLSDLVSMTYQDEPQTTEAGGGVRLHETVHVVIPEVSTAALASALVPSAAGASVTLVPGEGFAVKSMGAATSSLGTAPIQFALSGSAQVVWDVDSSALASALAGKPSGAFQTITNGFPGIQQASARIEPPWKSTFPSNPSDISIVIQTP
jgi:hypothetical protein